MFRGAPINYPEALSNILAMLTTWHDILPVGAPTSPVISNLLTYELDKNLAEYAAGNEGIYTRYADDITFSFNRWIDDSMILGIREIISEAGLTVNNSKFRVCSVNSQQSVTGLTVNEKVNVNRRYIRKVRAILHDWEINGLRSAAARFSSTGNYVNDLEAEDFLHSIRGRIDFIGFVRGRNDRLYGSLRDRYRSLASGNH